MSRWIDFDFVKSKKRFDNGKMKDIVWMQDIYHAPSIDLVRCGECKHQWREHKVCAHEANVVEGVCGKRAEDNDFCSYGERRTK